jgi:predicted nucleotidyltransferase
MSSDEPESSDLVVRFVDLLRREHGCHTVILYGSRARGDAGVESDYDLIGFRADGPSVRDARWIFGAYLDAFVYPESKVDETGSELLQVRGGAVLCEERGVGARLLARLEAVHAAGPAPLPADEALAIRSWAHKMVRRAARGDLEGHYRHTWLLKSLLEDYFALRGLWFQGPKAAFAWLAANAPEVHRAFAEALTPGARLDALARLAELVTETAPPAP